MAQSPAQQAFDALDDQTKIRIASRVFEVLEYDSDGNPGSEWSSDTTQALGDLFGNFGIAFSDPHGGV